MPDKNQIWIDYYTGQEYQGGQIINNFAAPLWKLPVFVKAGAIIPLAPATNTPNEYLNLKNQRRLVIYPQGTSSFTIYEDDGVSAEYQNGKYAQTKISSNLNDTDLTIKVAKTQGSYTGFEANKTTEFDVRTKTEPTSVTAKVADKTIRLTKVQNQQDFQARDNCYFFDQNYLTNSYLKDFDDNLTQTFLRIKIGKTDVSQNSITVKLTGINAAGVAVNELPAENDTIAAPTELTQNLTKSTSNSIAVSWQKMAGDETYNLKIDDILYTNILEPQFVLTNIKPATEHTFQVQVVKKEGASPWSASKIFKAKSSAQAEN